MKTWNTPIDKAGDATYTLDYEEEMVRLSDTLSSVTLTPDQAAIDAGLELSGGALSGDFFSYSVKFKINAAKQSVIDKDGLCLNIKASYITTAGEADGETVILLVKDK